MASKEYDDGDEAKPEAEKYKEIISSLPICPSSPDLRLYKGFWWTTELLEPLLSVQDHFTAQPSDIFLCSYPKTGTTWLKALAFAIATRTRYNNINIKEDSASNPFLTNSPQALIQCLDEARFDACDPNLPIIATHFPYPCLPPSVISSNSKLVYICRDPKDVVVSLYRFLQKFVQKPTDDQTLFNFVYEGICQGHLYGGPYWDHVLGFWKASLENPGVVLFLKYEEVLKKDTPCYVKRLAEFMGYPFSPEEVSSGEVEKIVKMCSIENLKNFEGNKTGYVSGLFGRVEVAAFLRKGQVGDWKNYLNQEMGERIDKIYEEKLSPFGLSLSA